MAQPVTQVVEIPFKNLKGMIGNPRHITPEEQEALKKSILKFGYVDLLIVDENDTILGGNQRYQVMKKLVEDEEDLIQVVRVQGLSEDDKKALNIALNNISGENDAEKLALWIEDLQSSDYDFDEAGIYSILEDLDLEAAQKEAEEMEAENAYSKAIKIPVYEPKMTEKPLISSLYDKEKAKALIEKIDKSEVKGELKEFLKCAAYRHLKFNYENIAEFYAHCSQKEKELFEDSVLVIIDFKKALQDGYVKMNDELSELYLEEEIEE